MKQRRPRQFNLKYRYYDEHKERLRESEERVRKQLGMDKDKKEGYRVDPERIRNSMRDTLEDSRQKKRDMVRLGIVLGFVVICFYLFIHYVL